MKEYYDLNKQRMIQQIVAKQKMIRNSDKYIEDNSDQLIEELKDGRRKFLQMTTLAKYNININPKTLKYYHDSKHKGEIVTKAIEQEEETLTEAIEQEPEAIPTTEAHRMMATMIKDYAKEYIEAMEEKPKTEDDKNLEDATNYFKTWSTDKIEEVEPTTPTPTSDSGEWEEAMTAEDLTNILEQDEITDEEINKLAIYLRKKKNKRKRNLLREIRDKFKF